MADVFTTWVHGASNSKPQNPHRSLTVTFWSFFRKVDVNPRPLNPKARCRFLRSSPGRVKPDGVGAGPSLYYYFSTLLSNFLLGPVLYYLLHIYIYIYTHIYTFIFMFVFIFLCLFIICNIYIYIQIDIDIDICIYYRAERRPGWSRA